MDVQRKQRLDEVAAIAVKIEAETGLPAAIMVAQWATESMWGKIPVGNANYFGIKKAARHEKCCTVTTREVVGGKFVKKELEFADYGTLEESCRDYAWLIMNGKQYAEAWQRYQSDKSVTGLILGVANKYATNPSYAIVVAGIAGQDNILEALTEARGHREVG